MVRTKKLSEDERRKKHTPKGIDWEHYLIKREWAEKYSHGVIASKLGCSRSAVQAAASALGIPGKFVAGPSQAKADWEKLFGKDKLHEKRTPEQIAERTGAAVSTVKRRIWEHKRREDRAAEKAAEAREARRKKRQAKKK